ncbi:hypothetical protein [Saccharospirillum alexandrii]|uniref:hypothetical protein n=1 Tax=Saccharospirillum alexandrii TaxID=2448477 RepID=UPI000FDA27FC|nr:hypothetical protein [Saccharospirillum alexandrii]
MKQRWVLAGLALVSLATVGGLAALKPDFESAQAGAARSSTTSIPESTAPASIADGAHDAGYSTPRTGVARTPAAPRLKSPGEIPDAETGAVPLDNEVSLPANLRQSLTQVADVYREQTRYPTFSQPIGSELDALRYRYNQPQQVSIPFPLADGATFDATLTLDRYHYFIGDEQQITFSLTTSDDSLVRDLSLSVTDLAGTVLHRQSLSLPADSSIRHTLTVDLSDQASDWPRELQWRLQASVGQQRLSVAAPFTYEAPVATLTGITNPHIDGEFLVLPLSLDYDRSGYYFVQANLYSTDGDPLLHLETEGPLTATEPGLRLRASGPALIDLDAPGPYVLRDVHLTRMGGNGVPDLQGQAPQDAFPIPAFDLEGYADSSWSDPLAQQRQEFLDELSNNL